MACGDLLTGFTIDCSEPLQGGVGGDSRLILLGTNHITAITYDITYQVTAITKQATKTGFAFEGVKQSLKPSHEVVQFPSGLPGYRHQIIFSIFAYTQLQKNNIELLAKGRYLAVIENPKKDANAFEIYGINVGLEANVIRRANQEEGGAYVITLTSPEGEPETKLPTTIAGATYAAAKAIADGLLV